MTNSNNSHSDNLQPRTTLKKVKVLCQQSKDPNQIGSPVLSSSNTQKNINMVKALQQINQMMSSQNYSNSISAMSQISTANVMSQPNLKTTHSTKNLLSHQQQQHLLHSQNSQQQLHTFAKSPKPIPQNLINIPLSLKSSQINAPSNKMKQIQQKAAGVLMQKCESHQSLLQYNSTNQKTASKQKVQQSNKENQNSLSPNDKNGKSSSRVNKLNRQSSAINFNILSNNFNQGSHQQFNHQNSQKSLSPINKVYKDNTGSNYHNQNRQSNERIKSLDNYSLEAIQKVIQKSGQFENEKRTTQQIRISPQKQFIVQSCLTQQTSPSEQFKKHAGKITLKNSQKQKQNHILEQEDYLLPQSQQEDQTYDQQQYQEYSLKKDYQTLVHHNHQMSRDNQSLGKYPRESEESINKGFLTDRQQASAQDLQNVIYDMQPMPKKTKGISYTRNAQELKKLLLETGVIGNLGLTSSLATAAAGMISQTQDTLFIKNNDITTKTTKNPHKSQTAKVKNSEIFSFSSKGKSSKMVVDKSQKPQVQTTCLLENQMLQKKGNHQRIQSQLENSSSNMNNMKNTLKTNSTIDHNLGMPPSSTQNKLKEFILKEDDETPSRQYQNYIDDQVIYNTKRFSKSPQTQLGFHNNGFPSRRSPSSQVAIKEDDQSNINFPFTETEQFIQRNENKRTMMYSGSVIDVHNQNQNQLLSRCWTAQGDISSERDRQKQYVIREFDGTSTGHLQTKFSGEDSRIDSMSGVPLSSKPIQVQGLTKQNHHAQSHLLLQKRQSCASSHSKNTCFTYNQHQAQSPLNRYHFSSMISDENMPPNIMMQQQLIQQNNMLQNTDMTQKELEILKFKMIAFVKTYENEFQKMKIQMSDLRKENQQLKKKVNTLQSRRMSASTSTNNHNSQYSNIATNKGGVFLHQNPNTCLTSVHTSQIHS